MTIPLDGLTLIEHVGLEFVGPIVEGHTLKDVEHGGPNVSLRPSGEIDYGSFALDDVTE